MHKNKGVKAMSKLGDEKTLKTLKNLRDSLNSLITLYEKDEEEITEEEVNSEVGKFMVAILSMDALK